MESDVLAMEYVYNQLYQSQNWRELQQTRKQEHMLIRHLVRYFFYTTTERTLQEVAQIEALLLKRDPVSHDTIINSIDQSTMLKKTQLYKQVGEAVAHSQKSADRSQNIYQAYVLLPPHKQLSIMRDLLQSLKPAQALVEGHPDFMNNKPFNT